MTFVICVLVLGSFKRHLSRITRGTRLCVEADRRQPGWPTDYIFQTIKLPIARLIFDFFFMFELWNLWDNRNGPIRANYARLKWAISWRQPALIAPIVEQYSWRSHRARNTDTDCQYHYRQLVEILPSHMSVVCVLRIMSRNKSRKIVLLLRTTPL